MHIFFVYCSSVAVFNSAACTCVFYYSALNTQCQQCTVAETGAAGDFCCESSRRQVCAALHVNRQRAVPPPPPPLLLLLLQSRRDARWIAVVSLSGVRRRRRPEVSCTDPGFRITPDLTPVGPANCLRVPLGRLRPSSCLAFQPPYPSDGLLRLRSVSSRTGVSSSTSRMSCSS